MPSIPKTPRREHSAETLAIIISMHEEGKSHAQISDHLKLAKSTVTSIIHRHNRQLEHPLRPTTRSSRPLMLDDRARILFIRHIEQNPRDNLKALGTPSKSGQTLSRAAVRKHLKADGYFRFKARKILFYLVKTSRLDWDGQRNIWGGQWRIGTLLYGQMRLLWDGIGYTKLLRYTETWYRNGMPIS